MVNSFNKYLKDNKNTSDSLTIKQEDIIRLTKKTRFTNEIVEKALEGIIIPFPNFSSFKMESQEDWDTLSDKYGDSYQLYIHSLRFVNELLVMFEITEDINYLNKAKEYIDSWIEFSTNNDGSNMVWYDHPTAQRIQVIIFYLYLAQNKLEVDEKLFINILKYHSKFLADSTNYRRNNHGLMMDRSLMILGNILNNTEIFNIGYYRSIDTFWHSYSYTGLHLENSPEYHNMVTNMYIELQKYLSRSGKTYGKTIVSYLNQATRLKNVFTKPNKIIPSIGDSGHGSVKVNKEYRNFVDYAAGLSIIQKEDNEYFLTFISGYSSITHKHFDDLSFNLFYKGKDLLVDPGKYSYSKHPYRNYVKSYKGHSGVFINNENYEISDENRLNKHVYTEHHFENEKYILIKGRNSSYSEGDISRTIIFIKAEQVTIILDEVIAFEKISVLHNFNLHHKVEPIKMNDSSYKLVSGNVSLVLTQHDGDSFTKVVGDKNTKPYKAINSVVFNEVIETTQLKNTEDIEGNQRVFKLFSIHSEKHSPILNLDKENCILNVSISSNTYIINI